MWKMSICVSNRVAFVLLGFCVMVTVVYFIPWTEKAPGSLTSSSHLHHFSNRPKLANSNLVKETDAAFREPTFDFTASLLRLLRLFSIDNNAPLFILDENLLVCLLNLSKCLSTLENEAPTYFMLGYMDEIGFDVEKTVLSRFKSNEWAIEQKQPCGHVVVKSPNSKKVIILAKMENRSNYWYIEEIQFVKRPAFAIPKPGRLKTVDVSDGLAQLVLPDISVSMFRRQLENSRFLTCNTSLSENLRSEYQSYYSAQPTINDSVVQDLAYLRDLLLTVDVPVFLCGGTLLGWYRECGIIPYTTDMDVNILATDYNEKLEETLWNDKKLILYWRLGKPSDSLEFSVFSGSTKFDLFFLYQKPNTDLSWVGGMIAGSKTKLKWIYPKLDALCSGDLLGHLFHVPCDVEARLHADYGDGWRVPHHNDRFVWHSSHNNVKQAGHWSAQEWPDVYRIYNQ